MRPFLALLIVVGLLVSTYLYTNFAASVRPPKIDSSAEFSVESYSVRLSRTFDCEGNAEFGLDSALEVVFKQKKVIDRKDRVPVDQPIVVDLPTVEVGRNVVYVTANLPSQFSMDFNDSPNAEIGFASKSHAMRVEVLKGNQVVADETFWIAPGLNTVSGSVDFSEQKSEEEGEHDHDH